MFTVSIKDEVTQLMRDVQMSLDETHLNPMIGAAMVRLFQDHFAQQPGNQRGFPTQHYWGSAAKSTSYELLPDGFTLRVAQPGVNMHVTGIPEVIRPINAKNLAIPAVAAAYGRRPGEFSNLRVAFRRKGGNLEAYALVEKSEVGHRGEKAPHQLYTKDTHGKVSAIKNSYAVGTGNKKRRKSQLEKAATGTVIFWLTKEVHTHIRPDTIPTEDQMRAEAISVAEQQIRLIQMRHGG